MKAAIAIAVLAISGGALFLFAAPQASGPVISEAVAKPYDGGAVAVFSITNDGPPDRLIAASSPAGAVEIYSPADPLGVPVPAGTASLALDAAHLRIVPERPVQDGQLLPVTLTFAQAGEVQAKLRLSDPAKVGAASDVGLFGLGDICIVGENEPAPAISLQLAPDGDGWRVEITSEEFTFSKDLLGLYHVPGIGHAHLYVGGMKLGRMFENTAFIGALPPGAHEVRVTLNTNDHRAYVVGDVPVTATALIVVE